MNKFASQLINAFYWNEKSSTKLPRWLKAAIKAGTVRVVFKGKVLAIDKLPPEKSVDKLLVRNGRNVLCVDQPKKSSHYIIDGYIIQTASKKILSLEKETFRSLFKPEKIRDSMQLKCSIL